MFKENEIKIKPFSSFEAKITPVDSLNSSFQTKNWLFNEILPRQTADGP